MKFSPSHLLGIICLLIVAFATVHICTHREKTEDVTLDTRNLRDLNATLTNEMSDTSDLAGMDRKVQNFMSKWNLQGASLTIMRNDSLVYSKGYGWADEKAGVKMSPGIILRMASVSKLVTAVGIMTLCERGDLSLDTKVFGPEGILCDSTYTAAIKDKNYYNITVEHLLRHQGGFTTRHGDPLFSTRDLMLRNRWDTPPDQQTLLISQLGRRLSFVPGTSQSYSNLGYLILSMVIEKVTGEPYEKWMQENVLRKAGCRDFHIAQTYYSDKYPNETRYHMQVNDPLVDEYNNSGRQVERCYGGNDIRGLSGAGAWVASSAELARLVASIDGRDEVPDILSPESVRKMTEYIDDETYSLGWNDTKPTGEWTRTGTLSGTTALIKYYPDGECWIFISNTGTWVGPRLSGSTAKLFRECREKYSSKLPHRDFFYLD